MKTAVFGIFFFLVVVVLFESVVFGTQPDVDSIESFPVAQPFEFVPEYEKYHKCAGDYPLSVKSTTPVASCSRVANTVVVKFTFDKRKERDMR
jgi:hypothetical protein